MTTESIIDRIIYFFIENKITEKDYLSNLLKINQIEIDEYQFLELYNEIINSGLFEFKKENTKDSKDLLFITNDKAQRKFKANTSYFDYRIAKNKKENDKSNSVVISGSKNVNVVQGSDFRDLTNEQSVAQEPQQKAPENKTIWSNIPEWAKILGGIGAIASLIKVVIELNKP